MVAIDGDENRAGESMAPSHLPVNSINQPIFMDPSEYPIVFCIKNDTASDLHLHLEMIPEDVILSPGHSVELLAKPTEGLLPITIDCVDGGLQIHACREFDPDWHVRFNGKLIKAGNPTHLKDHE